MFLQISHKVGSIKKNRNIKKGQKESIETFVNEKKRKKNYALLLPFGSCFNSTAFVIIVIKSFVYT